MPDLPNYQTLLNSRWLRAEPEADWVNASVPLHERGVRLDWLIGFLKEAGNLWQAVVRRQDEQSRASFWFDAPEPDPLPFPRDTETSVPAFLVPHLIKPLTRRFGSNAFTTLYSINSYHKRRNPLTCVWIDVASYNQHEAEAIADDMKSVIGTIGQVVLPMVNSVPFSRLWCLWELLYAHVTGAEIVIVRPFSSR